MDLTAIRVLLYDFSAIHHRGPEEVLTATFVRTRLLKGEKACMAEFMVAMDYLGAFIRCFQ